MLGLSFDPLSSIPPELRELLRAAGFSARREQAAPLVYVKRPEKRAKAPGRPDVRRQLACLRAILVADDAGELAPVTLEEPTGSWRFACTRSGARATSPSPSPASPG